MIPSIHATVFWDSFDPEALMSHAKRSDSGGASPDLPSHIKYTVFMKSEVSGSRIKRNNIKMV
jgi:hypothetical protein